MYVLDYYSLENYYFNKEVVEKTLSSFIINPNLATDFIISSMYQEILNYLIENLYYISLEALKKSCDNNYDAIIGYKPNNIDDFLKDNRLIDRRNDLDIFAKNKNIKKTEDNIYKIVKGKWLISTFCNIYFKKIKELETKCNKKEITQCDNCLIDEISEPCLYKPRKNKLNSNDLEEKIYELIDLDSLTLIKERIKQLK